MNLCRIRFVEEVFGKHEYWKVMVTHLSTEYSLAISLMCSSGSGATQLEEGKYIDSKCKEYCSAGWVVHWGNIPLLSANTIMVADSTKILSTISKWSVLVVQNFKIFLYVLDPHIMRLTGESTHTHIRIYIYIYIYMFSRQVKNIQQLFGNLSGNKTMY